MKNVLIINNETKNLNLLEKTFQNLWYNVKTKNLTDNFYSEKFDLLVLSWWSNHSVFYKPSPYKKEINFIKKIKKPIIWICLGAQIIAKAFGWIIDFLGKKIRWIKKIKFWNKFFKVFESHKFWITKLNDNLIWLSKSKYWSEIFKHKNKKIYWLQFHPEKTIKSNQWIIILKKILNQIQKK